MNVAILEKIGKRAVGLLEETGKKLPKAISKVAEEMKGVKLPEQAARDGFVGRTALREPFPLVEDLRGIPAKILNPPIAKDINIASLVDPADKQIVNLGKIITALQPKS